MYDSIAQMNKILGNVDKWLEAATTYATEKKFDPNVLLGMRLAPDMLPFSKQIQIMCDTAKLGASRLTGKEAPSHTDNEQTIEELRARVKSTRSFLDGLTAKDFDGADKRVISQPRWEGKTMTGANYFKEHVTPNFYFHATTTYAILRHNGVPIGKRDYLGALTLQ